MKKKCIALLCILCLLLACLPVSASAYTIVLEEKTLITGVTYRHQYQLMDNGWQDIHIVQADMTRPHLKFDVLSNENGKNTNPGKRQKRPDRIHAELFLSGGRHQAV